MHTRSTRRSPPLPALLLTICACSFDGTGQYLPSSDGSATDTGAEPGSTSLPTTTDAATVTTGETTDTPTTAGSMSMSMSMSMTGEGVCGDGSVDPGEACDDGPANDNTAACKSNCTLAICGDGFLGPDEACDDANTADGDGCSADCVVEEECGDGVTQPPETCDDGSNNGAGKACKADCTPNVCGDGDQGPTEGCDDGNMVGGDGCSPACAPEGCGDGVVQAPEACDDGNMNDGDGCSAACTSEVCGDGVVQAPEACDDGNMNDTDNCTTMCKLAVCGDGFVQGGVEACDDGNMTDSDACTNTCMVNVNRVFVSSAEYQGDLGGVAGADAKCQTLATNAGLGGTWMAWISDNNGSSAPTNRFTTKSALPYVKVDGTKVADSWADLTDGSLDSPIDRYETGAPAMGENDVWSNTTPSGAKKPGDYECYDWTDNGDEPDSNGQIGSLMAVNGGWSDVNQTRDCNNNKRIYCFEQ